MTDKTDLNTMICGVEQPKRIWLMAYRHAGDVCWTSDPNPEDADEIEVVEYVRADLAALQPKSDAPQGSYRVEGSIYEGMSAAVTDGKRTIAHCPDYADALAIADALAARDQRIAELEAVVEKCRDKFLDYHQQHFDKANADNVEPDERRARMHKSQRNLEMANLCRNALKQGEQP